jgi:Polyketide cyclase / dehydrase and lipid transport
MSFLVSRTKTVNASAETIFEILASPSRHNEIDGSGSIVAAASNAPERLSMGAQFGMSMKIGVPYKIENTVVEFDSNRRIAWKHFGGHVWRYDLQPIGDGTKTEVTETFDWSTAKSKLMMKVMRYPEKNAKSIEKTLDRLAAKFA